MKVLSSKNYVKLQTAEETLEEKKQAYKQGIKELQQEHKEYKLKSERQKRELQLKVEDLEAENHALNGLKNDATAVKTLTLELQDREKVVKQREENVKKREDDDELEDTKKYKAGYEDGVADGLRKGYDLTADDRQNMASIAALAAASHSDGATQKIAEQIVIGMQKGNRVITSKASK